MADKVVILVQSKRYEVSKEILIQKSSYFNSMFNGDFLERNESTVSLQEVKAEPWERILYYLEHGKMELEAYSTELCKGLLQVLEVATMLQFTEVQEKCMKSLYETIEPENALQILEVASKLDLDVLIQKARAVALWNCDVITESDYFSQLNADQVQGYLSDPALHSSHGEWGIWQAIDRWINSPTDFHKSRTEFLPNLIKCVSLEKLNLTDLKTISLNYSVRSFPIVSASLRRLIEERTTDGETPRSAIQVNESCGKVLESFQSDNTSTHQDEEVKVFIESWRRMPPRRLPMVPAVIAKVNRSGGLVSPYVVRFSEVDKKFIPVLRLDEVETSLSSLVGFKVIANGSKLYMLGGEIMTRQVSWYYAVWQYDQILKQWMFLANLRKEVRHSSVCIVGDDLYVIGGFGRHRLIQDSVSKLSITERIWTSCAPLPRPMYSVPCCVFKDKIYVIQNQVYQYSPERDSWTALDIELPKGQVICIVVVNDDYIFVSGRSKTVYKFDPSLPSVKLEEVGKFQFECSQACLIDNYIYSLSEEEFDVEIYCEKMDVETGKSTVLLKEAVGDEIVSLSANHHHGCFPLIMY